MAVTPVRKLSRRMPRHGKIRIGEKGSKGEPRKLSTFRFTSQDEGVIRAIADRYGGEANVWTGGPDKGAWEVTTEAKEIPIALPADPLGDTPVYELWSGGGCLRRCDGEVCLVPKATEDGTELVDTPCICEAKDQFECKVTTRLTVILREVAFGGGWMLESHGWNAAHELPGMIEAVQAIQAKGLVGAVLALEERSKKVRLSGGKTRTNRFVVPVVRPAISLDALAAGGGAVVQALPAAPADVAVVDEEVAEAEVELKATCRKCGEVVSAWDKDALLDAIHDHKQQHQEEEGVTT